MIWNRWRSTVNLWERRTAAAFLTESLEFRKLMFEMLHNNEGFAAGALDGPMDGQAICVSQCDATNPAVWQTCKLHALSVRSVHHLHGKAKHVSRSGLAGLLVVRSSDCISLLSMMRKQLRNLGVPLWDELGDMWAKVKPKVDVFHDCVYAYLFVTDAGGDVACARRVITKTGGKSKRVCLHAGHGMSTASICFSTATHSDKD